MPLVCLQQFPSSSVLHFKFPISPVNFAYNDQKCTDTLYLTIKWSRPENTTRLITDTLGVEIIVIFFAE